MEMSYRLMVLLEYCHVKIIMETLLTFQGAMARINRQEDRCAYVGITKKAQPATAQRRVRGAASLCGTRPLWRVSCSGPCCTQPTRDRHGWTRSPTAQTARRSNCRIFRGPAVTTSAAADSTGLVLGGSSASPTSSPSG
ncbi:unnamed protein product [Nesidiocoris tenuis]|uniref:Uncharacterized protein n=1 Tax=Nesidiocoris tenuis TaxID=355587 RepID=A0A6H5GZH0_9HEMI|nr:unnamed protein product [Nesidiocoris tenuis]